ncbi:phosphoserine phosphatase SerB [Corynebacterium uropygiale]|uniref:phosphoserine phosphatase n=1 Tax=Corynebacterium uropygiale TaxID=1775911 RepID=A0A9X1QTU7_9CORY|nr:phosphoserine phosphatase SerB [Corynebacterium uropygiale]
MTTHPEQPHTPLEPGLVPGVITVTGPDRPGVSAAAFRVLSSHAVQVLDVEQSQFRGRLSLAVFCGLRSESADSLESGLVGTLSSYGQSVSVEVSDSVVRSQPRSTHVMVVLGSPVTARDISRIGQTLADFGTNIDRIRGIADYPITGLEFRLTVPDPTPGESRRLRAALAALTPELGVDIAVERAGLLRRAKRLVCFDCDSTLISGEVIDMLAAHAGREKEVAEVTERAMRGELDFAESLRQRVEALAGLDARVLEDVARSIELSPGARTTIRTLRRLGYTTAVVSGGFTQVLDYLVEDLGINHARANELEIVDGKLTGRVIGSIVDREAKARFLREFAEAEGLHMHRTVAVGDGANDIDMLSAAGLGIAFNAKPALREVADASVNNPFLDEVLYMMGIPRAEIEASDLEDGSYRRVPLQ